MKKSMHINERIPVTITHVKENRKSVKKREIIKIFASIVCILVTI